MGNYQPFENICKQFRSENQIFRQISKGVVCVIHCVNERIVFYSPDFLKLFGINEKSQISLQDISFDFQPHFNCSVNEAKNLLLSFLLKNKKTSCKIIWKFKSLKEEPFIAETDVFVARNPFLVVIIEPPPKQKTEKEIEKEIEKENSEIEKENSEIEKETTEYETKGFFDQRISALVKLLEQEMIFNSNFDNEIQSNARSQFLKDLSKMENIFENQYNDSVEKLKELSNLFQMDKIETFNFRKFIDQQIRKNFEISQNDEEKQILHLFSQNLFLKRSFLALNETLKRQSLINENLKKIIRDKLD